MLEGVSVGVSGDADGFAGGVCEVRTTLYQEGQNMSARSAKLRVTLEDHR